LITPRFLWAEIERLANDCQASYKDVGSLLPSNASSPSNQRDPVVLPSLVRTTSEDNLEISATGRRRKARRIGVFGPATRKTSKSLIARPHETEKNTRIIQGLEKIYGVEKTRTVLEQALTMYHVSNPQIENSPEIYELEQSGYLDQALEFFGQSWVIGRPRLD